MKYIFGTALYILFKIAYTVIEAGQFLINQDTLFPLVIESLFALVAFWVADFLLSKKSAK